MRNSCFVAVMLLLATGAQAQRYSILHEFSGGDGGSEPIGGVALNPASTVVYGTTSFEGVHDAGTLWSLNVGAGKPQFAILVAFGGAKGATPRGRLLYADTPSGGTLCGTTLSGGALSNQFGEVFSYTIGTGFAVVHRFGSARGGVNPFGGVTLGDFNGTLNLYGTTLYGGDLNACGSVGCGTVFEIAAGNKFSILHRFTNSHPSGSAAQLVTFGGQLYGTTFFGVGTPFVINPTSHRLTYFASPGGPSDGGLAVDGNGNFWGFANNGGAHGYGDIYRIDPAGKVTDVYDFSNAGDSANPRGTPAIGRNNVLYGVTIGVGGNNDPNSGTVFQFDTITQKLTTLHHFEGLDGSIPSSGVTIDATGNLYGATVFGGKPGVGVIYKITF